MSQGEEDEDLELAAALAPPGHRGALEELQAQAQALEAEDPRGPPPASQDLELVPGQGPSQEGPGEASPSSQVLEAKGEVLEPGAAPGAPAPALELEAQPISREEEEVLAASPSVVSRFAPLRYHAEQQRLISSRARFKIVHSGRRSGKTEIAKRLGLRRALEETRLHNLWVVFAAPTQEQARRIFWQDLKAMVPRGAVERIYDSLSNMTIRLVNGAELSVLGIDKPERLEGRPLDWICIDEFANCRPGIWQRNIRPALMTSGRPPGEAWLIGVPEGQNHMHALVLEAREDIARHAEKADWGIFRWDSADIISAAELESAMKLDPLTFDQEMRGAFVSHTGRAYYPFDRALHTSMRMDYEPGRPLTFCFDFNISPGVAVVLQERTLLEGRPYFLAESFDAVVGEVWIPASSNTPAVCRRLIADWGPGGARAHHEGRVIVDGDWTGGAQGSAKPDGSDWDFVKKLLRPVAGWKAEFLMVPNPAERVRVNALNARLLGTDGLVRLMVDPTYGKHLADDLELVMLLPGGSGELWKDRKRFPERTDISDALGYHVARAHPLTEALSSYRRF